MWWTYALLSAFFAALTTIFAKVGVADVTPNLATAIRTIVILIMAWGIVAATGETAGLPLVSARSLLFLTLSAVATGLSWMCYFQALQVGQATAVAGIDKTSLVMTLVLAVMFLGEPLALKSVAGVLLILGGALLLIR
ncbi:MAG: EamA family transporter [Nitrospiraceae bacterium]|nr:EamA family transporter [Nitrospiraceae bacterium]